MNISNRKLLQIASLVIAAFVAMVPAQAQDYPNKPIRLVVPFPPGGAVDLYARLVQVELQKTLGQPVIVDNKTGASGMIGADSVAKSAPDGYTLLVGNVAVFSMNSAVYKKVPYQPLVDFTPVIQTVMVPYVLVVNPEAPTQTVGELLVYAKTNPNKLSYGSSGSGSAQHMAAELFKSRTDAQLTHVPYKGVGPLISDLIAGHIQVAFIDQASAMPHVKAGKIRLLGVASAKRTSDLPDVPTIAEVAKLPGFEISGWQGIVGPAGLPGNVVKRLNEAVNRAHAQPAIREAFSKAGLVSVGGKPEALTRQIKSELATWSKVARDVNVAID